MQNSAVRADGRRWCAGVVRRVLVAMIIGALFLTISAIVRPVADAGHRNAQSAGTALMADDAGPAPDQPQIGLAGGDLNHIPAALVGADLMDLEFDTSTAVGVQPVMTFAYRHATWLKGFDPPP